jgi:hypothetical protein
MGLCAGGSAAPERELRRECGFGSLAKVYVSVSAGKRRVARTQSIVPGLERVSVHVVHVIGLRESRV